MPGPEASMFLGLGSGTLCMGGSAWHPIRAFLPGEKLLAFGIQNATQGCERPEVETWLGAQGARGQPPLSASRGVLQAAHACPAASAPQRPCLRPASDPGHRCPTPHWGLWAGCPCGTVRRQPDSKSAPCCPPARQEPLLSLPGTWVHGWLVVFVNSEEKREWKLSIGF